MSRRTMGGGTRDVGSTGRSSLRQQVEALHGAGRADEAVALLEARLLRFPRDVECLRLRAILEQRTGREGLAATYAERAEAIEWHPSTAMIVAHARAVAGKTDEALARCHALLDASPGDFDVRLLMAQALESAMRTVEAREVLEPLLSDLRGRESRTERQAEQLLAAVLIHEEREGEAVALLDRVLADGGGDDAIRRTTLYLRTKALDRLKRYDEAWASAAAANAIGEPEFDPRGYADAMDALAGHWTRQAMGAFPSSRSASEVPVFIAGMPRSGTSLLDQVIDAHPEAAGVGETSGLEHFARVIEGVWDASLPPPDSFGPMRDRAFRNVAAAYLAECRRHAPEARRIVNKALGNNRLVGLLSRLFPRTRVIHALRDPRDVAVSCFMGGFNSALYPWTARVEWIAVAWERSLRLMEHWRQATDLPILEVRYEEVIVNPGVELPRLIEFLGLGWDERCTRFHESRRTVRTLSYDQVNRPLYPDSVRRWQRYEKFLRGVDWPTYES